MFDRKFAEETLKFHARLFLLGIKNFPQRGFVPTEKTMAGLALLDKEGELEEVEIHFEEGGSR